MKTVSIVALSAVLLAAAPALAQTNSTPSATGNPDSGTSTAPSGNPSAAPDTAPSPGTATPNQSGTYGNENKANCTGSAANAADCNANNGMQRSNPSMNSPATNPSASPNNSSNSASPGTEPH